MIAAFLLVSPATVQAEDYIYITNKGTITITKYTGFGGDVTIPSEINGLPVTSIGNNAFDHCTSLTSVIIPDSVTTMGAYAFFGCTNLTAVAIPDSVTTIEHCAFSGCRKLTSVTIGNSVTIIVECAFTFCTNLTSVFIPNSVTNIGSEAFSLCTSLTNVTIGNSVAIIQPEAFWRCTSLAAVYFQGNAPSPDDSSVFSGVNSVIVYYLPGTTGWSATYGGRPTALWKPRIQTGDGTFGAGTNGFGFTISWASGRVVVVEASTNLTNPIWLPVFTNTLSSDTSYFTDPDSTNHPNRFYRVVSP